MQSFMCFVVVFAMSSATYVTVYPGIDLFIKAHRNDTVVVPKPVSSFSFGYHLNDPLYMRLYIINEPQGVIAITVIYQSGPETVEKSMVVVQDGNHFYWVHAVLNYTEVKIFLKLYKSNDFSFIMVAEGRAVMTPPNKITEEIYTYNDICLKPSPCVLLVNLEHGNNGPQIPPMTVDETTTPITHLKNNNNNAVTIVSPPSHEDTKTSTSNTDADADADHTDYTIIIIAVISSISGALLILLLAIWKRCWCKRSPSGTPQLPPHEPFYPNMLFRRECDEEIAEIDQHQYEEIDQHQYEEIIPRVTEGS